MRDDEPRHELVLEAVLRHLLNDTDLEHLSEQAGVPVLYGSNGQPVYLRSVLSYQDAGVLSLDAGLVVETSDGARLAVTIQLDTAPAEATTSTPPE